MKYMFLHKYINMNQLLHLHHSKPSSELNLVIMSKIENYN